jgi:phosphoglycolate phosphatase
MKQNEAIIFDLDGTLTNTLNISVAASREAIKKACGLNLSDAQITGQFGKSEDALFKHYCPDNWQRALQDYHDFFASNVTEKTLFPGIKDVLTYIKTNNIKTAVVTGRGASALTILQRTGARDYFDYVKTGSPLGSIKPQAIKEVLQAWGQDPETAYYIGDIAHDITDAKEAGVNALAASWCPDADKESQTQQQPLRVFHTVEDFMEWIKK